MAIIGFIVLVLLGLYFAAQAIGMAVVSLGFAGKFPWAYSGIFGMLCAGTWYYAFTHAPFHVNITTTT